MLKIARTLRFSLILILLASPQPADGQTSGVTKSSSHAGAKPAGAKPAATAAPTTSVPAKVTEKPSAVTAPKSSVVSKTTSGIKAVDLGLPSGVLWADRNVGASSPEDYGDYFAWGETAPKTTYSWETYAWGKENSLKKYNAADNKIILDPGEDVVSVKLGSSWRMPTEEEMKELQMNCTWTLTSRNGVKGYELKSKYNGNSIFLPAGGYYSEQEIILGGSSGYYWTATRDKYLPESSQHLTFSDFSNKQYVFQKDRLFGMSVRPVTKTGGNTTSLRIQEDPNHSVTGPKPSDIVIRNKEDESKEQFCVLGEDYVCLSRLYVPSDEYLSFDINLSNKNLTTDRGDFLYDYDQELRKVTLDMMQKLDEGSKESPLHLIFEDGEELICRNTNPRWSDLWDTPHFVSFTIKSDSFSSTRVQDLKTVKDKAGYLAKCLSTKNIKRISFEGIKTLAFYAKTAPFMSQAIEYAKTTAKPVTPVPAKVAEKPTGSSDFRAVTPKELSFADIVTRPFGVLPPDRRKCSMEQILSDLKGYDWKVSVDNKLKSVELNGKDGYDMTILGVVPSWARAGFFGDDQKGTELYSFHYSFIFKNHKEAVQFSDKLIAFLRAEGIDIPSPTNITTEVSAMYGKSKIEVKTPEKGQSYLSLYINYWDGYYASDGKWTVGWIE